MHGGPQVQYKNFNNPIQKNRYQHKNNYFSIKIFISVQKYLFQSKNIYFDTKKSFPKSINISQVSLRPAGRREVSQNSGFERIFKKKQSLIILRNYKYEIILGFLERFPDIYNVVFVVRYCSTV